MRQDPIASVLIAGAENDEFAPLASIPDAFLAWVKRQASADSIDLLLFGGIAGRNLQRIASEPQRSFPRSAYVPMDDAALTLADTQLTCLVDELQGWAPAGYGLSVREFFKKFDLPLPSQKFMCDLGLPEDTVIDRSTEALLTRFLFAYRWEILKVCREKRYALLRHFLQSGISNGMRVGIVDLGWAGEIQMILSSALQDMFDVQTYAYCFCLTDSAEAVKLRSAIPTIAMVSPENFSDSVVQMLFERRAAIETSFAALSQTIQIGISEDVSA